MKIYISSKITGNENYKQEFEKVEKHLIKEGYEVINPCKLPHEHGGFYREYMREDIKALLDCDQIYMFGDWRFSKGATMEHNIAKICGIDCRYEQGRNHD